MKLKYRPEIDGLRAIAVIAVILYHSKLIFFNNQIFEGGYIGVDIFFVISGYLITLIILRDLYFKGSFSLLDFYKRRIRRIIPVLLIVIFFFLPFGWFYLIPSSFIDFSKSILYSIGFSSNIYFWYSGQLYGADSGLLKPFLHTWSLSVEEQFYIFFPIILIFIFKYFKNYLIYFFLFGFILSLGLSDWGSKNFPSFNFYIMPTRVWELLSGSILAYFEISIGHRSKNKILNKILPSVGITLIGYSFITFNQNTFHPSFNTLLPIIGVCLIIWYSDREELISKILSTKLFVGIGLISYSLYLWHYPIFAFGRIIDVNYSQFDVIKWILITFLMSILSFYLIEKPSRSYKKKFNIILSIIISSFFVLIISQYYLIKNKSKHALKSGADGIMLSEKQLIGKGDNRFIIFGDSHAQHIMSYLKDISLSGKENISFYNVTHSACISLPNLTNIYKPSKKKFKLRDSCTNLYKNINQIIETEKNLIVIFYNTWFKHIIRNNSQTYNEDLKFSKNIPRNKKIIRLLLDDIIQLKKKNKVVKKWILVGKNPGSYNYNYAKGYLQCYNSNKSHSKQPYYDVNKCEKKGLIENGLNYQNHRLFKEIVNSEYSKDLVYIDAYELYCDKKYCYNFDENKKLIYYDHHHFTYDGSKRMVNKILETYYNIN